MRQRFLDAAAVEAEIGRVRYATARIILPRSRR